jgi:hypothetical protein
MKSMPLSELEQRTIIKLAIDVIDDLSIELQIKADLRKVLKEWS